MKIIFKNVSYLRIFIVLVLSLNSYKGLKMLSSNLKAIERGLLGIPDILALVKANIPTSYQIDDKSGNVLTCTDPNRPYKSFRVKVAEVKTPRDSFFSMTFTNSPIDLIRPGNFHGVYRFIFRAKTAKGSVRAALNQIFSRGKEEPKLTFFKESDKYAPIEMAEIFSDDLIKELIKDILRVRLSFPTKTAIYITGPCEKNTLFTCTLIIYQIDATFGGIEIKFSNRNFNKNFPLANFVESFRFLKEEIKKYLDEEIAKETANDQKNFSYSEFVTFLGKTFPDICPGCSVPSEIPDSQKTLQVVIAPFSIDKQEKTRDSIETKSHTVALQSQMVAFYIDLARIHMVFIYLKNERVRIEVVLPAKNPMFEKRLKLEGKRFVEMSKGDAENERKEIVLKIADLKKYFEEIKTKCHNGEIRDSDKGFILVCNSVPVIAVYDVSSPTQDDIKIDFLILTTTDDESEATQAGYVLAKVSLFDALKKIKPEIENYLQKF